MARPLATCGTEAAYRRHLRNGEKACYECRIANSEARARRRAKQKPEVEPLPPAPAASETKALSRSEELELLRETIWDGLRWAKEHDPKAIASLARELRATVSELERLTDSDGSSGEEDPIDAAIAGAASNVVRFPTAAT